MPFSKYDLLEGIYVVVACGFIGAIAACVLQWSTGSIEENSVRGPGSPTFFLSIRGITVIAAFLGAVSGAIISNISNDDEFRGDVGPSLVGGFFGCLIGALAARLLTHFGWAPEALAHLTGFDWSLLAEKCFGQRIPSPFWESLAGGALSGFTIGAIGFGVGLAGCWGDAGHSRSSRWFRWAVLWMPLSLLLGLSLVVVG